MSEEEKRETIKLILALAIKHLVRFQGTLDELVNCMEDDLISHGLLGDEREQPVGMLVDERALK